MIEDKLKLEINKLQNNHMFHLSLASKELFHSNFIAWLIEENPEYMDEVLQKYLTKIKINNGKGFVEREKMNFDLLIHTEDNCEILIENKVKSYPSKEQLERYYDKTKDNTNIRRILLTITNPNFEIDNWDILNYSELSKSLEQNISLIKKNKTYVLDYIDLIKCLVNIHNLFEESFNEDKVNFLSSGNIYQELNKIKLHDLYHKFIYHHKIKSLIEELSTDKSIVVGQYFSRGVGKTDCYIFNEDKAEGLFFQLDDYRICVYLVGDTKDKLTNTEEVKNYFKILEIIYEKYKSKFGNQDKRLEWDRWNRYKPSYKYKYLILNDKFSKEELKDIFKILIKNMVKHKDLLNRFKEVYK